MASVSPPAADAFTLRRVDYEVTPEPSEQERAAIDAVLRELDRQEPPAYRSAWRRAALDPGDEVYAATPPRNSRGATRA
jgi:hypothetical protein